MPKLGTTIWDAALARRLYDAGATYGQIGEQVGAAPSLISQFAARHWPLRDQAMVYQRRRPQARLGLATEAFRDRLMAG